MAERWHDRLRRLFGHELEGRQALVFYASGSDFRQTNVVRGIREGTGGVTEGLMCRIVMPSAGPLAETSHVLGHEFGHDFQHDMSSPARGHPHAHQRHLQLVRGAEPARAAGALKPWPPLGCFGTT